MGFETAIGLAQAGADVVIADRNEAQGRWAVGRIRPLAPGSLIRSEPVDLSSLASIRDFVRRIHRLEQPVDLLVNNAGVFALPRRQVSADGFELQFATNYLGAFALTAKLLSLLQSGRDPRVVQVGSLAHRFGAVHWHDLQLERTYTPMRAYCQSKLAMLMFTFELQRHSDAGRWGLLSVAAHPGYARTEMFAHGPGKRSVMNRMHRSLGMVLSHSAASGAVPVLFAATSPKAKPGGYYGPQGLLGMAGPSGAAYVSERAQDFDAAQRLWETSEKLTGAEWPAAEVSARRIG